MNSEGLFLRQQQLLVAELRPLQVVNQGTELLKHLNGFEEFWVHDIRPWILSGRTRFLVVWGRTGVGKQLAASEILHLGKTDPILVEQLAKMNATLTEEYISFAQSANLAKLRGLIDPSHQHGGYTIPEYRLASQVHSEFTLANLNNFEGPRLVVVEPSGPTGLPDEKDGTLTGHFLGKDKALSTVFLLGRDQRDNTKLLIIKKGNGLMEKIMATRESITCGSWHNLADILIAAHVQILKNHKVVDLAKMSRSDLIKLREKIISSMAPPEGVKENNKLTDQLMNQMGFDTDQEDEFWVELLRKLGFTPSDYLISENPVTKDNLSLHIDLLDMDPMQEEIRMRQALVRMDHPSHHLR